MPGKHVRFALPSLYTSSTATPPSPSHSSHSHGHDHHTHYSSSYGQGSLKRANTVHHDHSSSSYGHSSTLHRSSTLPSYSSSRGLHIHSLLGYTSHPSIHFDVSLAPSTITLPNTASSLSSLSRHVLSEPATTPPMSSMTLYVPHLSSSWRITVTPSNGVFISVGDVFDSVYYTMRTNVSDREYRAIRDPGDLKRVNRAYTERYRRIRDGYAAERERKGGVRRVDFLVGRTRFKGISVESGGRAFVLNLS